MTIRRTTWPTTAAIALAIATVTLFAQTESAAATPIDWKGPVQWLTWDAGAARATKSNQPMLLIVYADWCPKCRAIAPVFHDKELARLQRQVVMVRQNHDDKPDWLERKFGAWGSYVPRIFLLGPDGAVWADLNSGHPKYPMFYTPGKKDLIIANMRKAIDRARASHAGKRR